ncbi:MAG: porin [Rubrivivax sp.]|nr:porin [Rubrivivax sp.]
MKHTLVIAAAATLACGSALAQSSVNIYGRFNVTAEQQELNGVKTKVLNNNASRIGFKGTEDLGGGLTAGFVLEHGFNVDTGTPSGAFWGRQSEVNLAGGFGMLRLGTFTSEAYYATSDYIGLHNHETGTSSDALYAYIGRNSNKVGYRTPEFVKGLSLEGAVSAGEGGGRIRNYDFAGNWQIGALHLGFGYEKAGTRAVPAKQFAVSGLYDFGSFILGGMVQRDTDGYSDGITKIGNRTNARVSAAYILGSSEFHVNVGSANDYSKLADSSARQYTLGYNYNLSKRTKVYGYYTEIDDNKAGLYTGGPRGGGRQGEFSSLAAGVRHNF